MAQAIDHIEIRYRRADTVGAWTTLPPLPPGKQSLQIEGIERGLSYQIEARSVGTNGAASVWVQQTHTVANANQLPFAPTLLSALSVADGVHLSWDTDGVQRADVEYNVQRTNDVGGFPNVAGWADLANAKATAYTDGITDGVVRWYRVRAVDFLGLASAFSNDVNSQNKSVADGADVTKDQYIVYTGLSANLIPNGNFLLGNVNGWAGGGNGGFLSGGINVISSSDGAKSPSFNVIPGQKYRFSFTGKVNGSGTQTLTLRVTYQATYAPNIPPTTHTDFAGSLTGSLTTSTFDWVCPPGVFYASLFMYQLGTAPLLFTNVSAQDYGASGEWGADVTGSNQSATTASLSNQTSDNLASGSNSIIPGNYQIIVAGTNVWVNLGRWTFSTIPRTLKMEYQSGVGYNTSAHQQALTDIAVRTGNNTGSPNISGATYIIQGTANALLGLKIVAAPGNAGGGNTWDVYAFIPGFGNGNLLVYPSPGDTFVFNGSLTTDPGPASATVVVSSGNQIVDVNGGVTNIGGVPSSSITPISGLMPVEVGADKTLNHVISGVDLANLGHVQIGGYFIGGSPPTTAKSNSYTVAIFNVVSNDTSDVFNVQATLQWEPNGTFPPFAGQIWSWMDGWVDAPSVVGTGPLFGGLAPLPTSFTKFGFGTGAFASTSVLAYSQINFFGTVTGLSAGAHTISLIFNNWGTGNPFLNYIYAVLQQISS